MHTPTNSDTSQLHHTLTAGAIVLTHTRVILQTSPHTHTHTHTHCLVNLWLVTQSFFKPKEFCVYSLGNAAPVYTGAFESAGRATQKGYN